MSSASQSDSPRPKPKKPFWRPSRIVLWIVVAAAIVVIALEYRARSACSSTYKAIDQAMAERNEKGEGVYKTELGDFLRGSPKREPTVSGEAFIWRGVLKSYRLRLEYAVGGLILKAERE